MFLIITKLSDVYFSSVSNKEIEYKRVIFHTLKDMGGVYIKFLQAICITHKFMDGWGGPKEFEVFNNVPQEDIDIYRCIPDMSIFSSIETIPFACGSFAQVYRGYLKDNTKVAVKVLRPSIFRDLKNDLKKLRRIIKLVGVFLPDTVIDYKSSFEEFSRNCLLETDYEREIANMKYFSRLYKNHDYVVVPKVYEEYSSKYVIVQEFIEGPTLSDLIHNVGPDERLEDKSYGLTGSNIWRQLAIAGGEALRTAIVADYVFGDPHPGNIILLKNNKIAFIDFGIIANKPKSQKAFYLWCKAYYDILMGSDDFGNLLNTTCMCFCPDLANALKGCSVNNNMMDVIANALNMKASVIGSNNSEAKNLIQNGHFMKLFSQVLDRNNALKLKLDTHNFQLLKAMQSYLSSVNTIDTKYGNNDFAKIMIEAMEYAIGYCERVGISEDLIENTKYSIPESYEILIDMMSSLANNDEFLFYNISERMNVNYE